MAYFMGRDNVLCKSSTGRYYYVPNGTLLPTERGSYGEGSKSKCGCTHRACGRYGGHVAGDGRRCARLLGCLAIVLCSILKLQAISSFDTNGLIKIQNTLSLFGPQ